MSLYSQFGTNQELEQKGAWIEIETEEEDELNPRFLIARTSRTNKKYVKTLNARTKSIQRKQNLGVLNEEEAHAVLLDVFVESVLLDWENVRNKKGEILPFSKQNAKQLLTDLNDLYVALSKEAEDINNFKDNIAEACKEDEVKN